MLADILRPLIGSSIHHVGSTKEFITRQKGRIIGPNKCNASLDVKALFSCIPTEDAVKACEIALENDKTLKDRTTLTIPSIKDLLKFCLDTTYFVFQGEYYQQTHGVAMGSPVSPLVANIYMEGFEVKAIQSAPVILK